MNHPDPQSFRQRVALRQIRAQHNKITAPLDHVNIDDGTDAHPFQKRYFEALKPSLNAQLDELRPGLESLDARKREEAERKFDSLKRTVDALTALQ